MIGRIVSLPVDPHREALSLLPWYARGRLEPEEHARLEAHLADCAGCRDELELEHRLIPLLDEAPFDPERGWTRMKRRIAEGVEKDSRASDPRRLQRAVAPSWIGWAFAAQFLLIAAGGGILAVWLQPDRFHTLSSPAATTAGDFVVIFTPETTEQGIRTILRANRARIVDGPSAPGAYVLATPADERDLLLSRLRNNPHIVLIEPLGRPAAP